DEIHAMSYRKPDTGKQVCVFWACAYDGATGYLVDVIEGRDADDMDTWFKQFGSDERKHVAFFCSDMYDVYLNAAKKWCRLACIGVDRFHVAKTGVSCMDDARCRLQKGASNGADIKRRHRKLAANRAKRRREHKDAPWIEVEKKTICGILAICDSKHSHLRQAYLVLQPCYIWQDHPWSDRQECEKALDNWISRASGLEVFEMRRFAKTVAKYKQYLVTASISHISTARAESTNDKIKELKRKSRGFGSFDETRRRLLLAFGAPDAVEGVTAYERRRKARVAASKASK
ncbi:transposase, partial [Adlercreutzia sp. ZJ242]|uniref:transposase n=1 Tax=Adlercreutzia sp. ZJ242 TaxID=2709409 RepID=UPI00197EC883